jgi:hypothetical protein
MNFRQHHFKQLVQGTRREWLAGMICLWLAGGAAAFAEKGLEVSEYQVKAALVYNFTKFTQWPSNSFSAPDSPLVIGILGNDSFGRALDDAMAGEKLNGHPIEVVRFQGADAVPACHILFVSNSEKSRLSSILASLQDRSILTIGETDGFGQLGGMVNLVKRDNSIRFEINAGAAQRSGVKISSKLLNLPKAIKVETQKQ